MSDEQLAAYLDSPDAGSEAPAQFRAIRQQLRSPALWEEPPADLADRIAADITREVLSRPEPQPSPERRHRRGDGITVVLRPAWITAATAAVAAAIALVLLWPAGDITRIQLQGTELAETASALAVVRSTPAGEAITLDVSGLPPPPPGFYYQAWVRNDDTGRIVSIGTFHLRDDDTEIELWSGVPLEDYPIISVTLEPEDDDPSSSGNAVLIGELPQP